MAIASLSRDIELEIAFNVRHLGGYQTRTGKPTSPDFIRSASLHRLTAGSIDRLRDLGVTTIVDLRSTVERERDVTPDVTAAGIRVVHAPVFEQDASPVGLEPEFFGFAKVYEHFLERGKDAYRTLFETMARDDGAVLFHCAAGKDRTGVAAALLLELAGVPATAIVHDYCRSAELLKPMLALWEPRMQERGMSPERAAQLMASNAEDMAATLAYLGARWGDAEGYLQAIGVSDADISAVRARMCG
ncbi:MAG: tyrosine-protein phosphatase [Hyphomicrobiales bacterium]